MKRLSILSFALIFISSINILFAAPTTTKKFTSKATISKLLTITQTQQLNFGLIYVNRIQSGTVMLPVSGNISSSVHTLGGGETVGRYTIAGASNSGVSIAVDTNGTLSNGTTILSITYIPSATSVTLNNTGSGSLTVGGILTLPSTTPATTYSGTFNITVSYQ